MFKTIFSRLLFTYILVILTVLISLSLIVSNLFGQYVFEQKKISFEQAAYKISTLSESYMKNQIPQKQLESVIDSLAIVTDSKIYVAALNRQDIKNKQNVDQLNITFLTQVLNDVLDGKIVFKQRQYSNNIDESAVILGYPLRLNGKVMGAVLLISPVKSVENLITNMNLFIAAAAVIIMLVCTIVIFIISKRITKPLMKLEIAAHKLATGQSADDIKVKSNDEIGRLVNSFNDMKEQLQTTELMRREFIANVSHDLRTPLTSISGFIQGMIDGIVKPEQYPEILEIIKDESGRLINMTGEILELAKLQAKTIELHKVKLNFYDICEFVKSNFEAKADIKNIIIKNNVDKNIQINADESRIKQILINILSNAIKYSKEDKTISICASRKSTFTEISVADEGVGISEEDIQHIFDKFYRADKVRNTSDSGTGLGLNIVKNLVEMHGGKIWAKSQPGVGTTIFFTIPD
jgi:signal transduction histidine kinase